MKKSPLPDGVVIKSEKDYQGGIVFQIVLDDCYHKCYICEHKSIPPEVEHRLTHKGNEDLKYDWYNLLYSCVYCNRVKNQPKFYGGIIDPIKTDPEEYIELRMDYNEDLREKIVIVKKVKDDELVDITVELLDLVYNNFSTDNKREASVNLRNAVSKDISIFMIYIDKYLKNPNDKIAYTDITAVISREPCGQAAQFVGESRKACGFTVSCHPALVSACDTRHYKRLVNVNSTADWIYDFWHNASSINIFEEADRAWTLTLKTSIVFTKIRFRGSQPTFICSRVSQLFESQSESILNGGSNDIPILLVGRDIFATSSPMFPH